MSTPTIPKRPSRDEFTGDYAQDLDGLLGVIGDAQESLIGAASGIVTPYFKTSIFKHAAETRVRTPLPIGAKCMAVAVVKAIGTTLTSDGRPSTATYALQVLGGPSWRSLGRTQDNGEVLGITMQYDLAHTQPYLIRTASAVQSIAAAGGDKQLTGWDTTESSRGSVISDNGALFTVSEAGSYLVALLVRFQSGATYTKCEATIRAGGVNHGDSFVPAPMTDGGYFTCSAVLRLAAGGTFDASCFQDNAAAAARNVLSGASTGRRIAIHRLYNDTAPTGRVTLMYFGG